MIDVFENFSPIFVLACMILPSPTHIGDNLREKKRPSMSRKEEWMMGAKLRCPRNSSHPQIPLMLHARERWEMGPRDGTNDRANIGTKVRDGGKRAEQGSYSRY